MFPGDGAKGTPFPGATHLLHHVLGRVPSDFVCFGRVEVRACAEEESREGDEHEGEGHVPGHIEPVVGLVAEQAEYPNAVEADEQHAKVGGGDGEYGGACLLNGSTAR